MLLHRRGDAFFGAVLRGKADDGRGRHPGGDRQRPQAQRSGSLENRIDFVLADASATPLPSASFDFVWGEDAWCYVVDKAALVAEALRLLRPGGVVAFTEGVEGPAALGQPVLVAPQPLLAGALGAALLAARRTPGTMA